MDNSPFPGVGSGNSGAGSPIFSSPDVPAPTPDSGSNIMFTGGIAPKNNDRKKVIIAMAGVAAAVVAVAIIAVIILLKPSEQGNTGPTARDLALGVLTDEDVRNVNLLESTYRDVISSDLSGTDLLAEDISERITNGVASYGKLLDAIKQNRTIIEQASSGTSLTTLIQKMESNLPRFESGLEYYNTLVSAIENENEQSLQNIANEAAYESAVAFYQGYLSYASAAAERKEIDCSNARVLNYATGYDECDALDDEMDSADEQMYSSDVMWMLLVGSESDQASLQSNYVRDDLSDVYLKVKGNEVTNENK